jgi:hypothetical protein
VVWLGVRELGIGPPGRVGGLLALMVVLACLCCAVPVWYQGNLGVLESYRAVYQVQSCLVPKNVGT